MSEAPNDDQPEDCGHGHMHVSGPIPVTPELAAALMGGQPRDEERHTIHRDSAKAELFGFIESLDHEQLVRLRRVLNADNNEFFDGLATWRLHSMGRDPDTGLTLEEQLNPETAPKEK